MKASVWTDGSGLAKGGPAGCGYVAVLNDRDRCEGSLELSSGTNQQAEILAAAYALNEIPVCDAVVVWSDSEYVVKGMNLWRHQWARRAWKTSEGKPVKNQEHWRQLIAATHRHSAVEFRWCRGHASIRENERADVLAGIARERSQRHAAVAGWTSLHRTALAAPAPDTR